MDHLHCQCSSNLCNGFLNSANVQLLMKGENQKGPGPTMGSSSHCDPFSLQGRHILTCLCDEVMDFHCMAPGNCGFHLELKGKT
jgi:hypothetical protein